MRSADGELRDPQHHRVLAFHPDCPDRRRASCTAFLRDGLVSRRTPAALAAALLAISAIAPSGAFAAAPSIVGDATPAPGQAGNPQPATTPEHDPAGVSTALPPEAPNADPAPDPPPPAGNPPATPAPPAPPPSAGTTAPVTRPGEQPAAPAAPQPPTTSPPAGPPSTPAPPETAVPAPADTPAPASTDTTPAPIPAPVAISEAPRRGSEEQTPASGQRADATRQPERALGTAPAGREHATYPSVGSASRAPQPQAAATVATASKPRDAVRPGDRGHTVDAGESLWSIASDLLGGRASAARVAREVARLWELNRSRIGTGDPDLLMIGTRLRLR